jgi:hypothetical protein
MSTKMSFPHPAERQRERAMEFELSFSNFVPSPPSFIVRPLGLDRKVRSNPRAGGFNRNPPEGAHTFREL